MNIAKGLIVCATLALLPALAVAHAHLESAQPANGSTVKVAPAQATLRFSDSLALVEVTIEKVGGKPEVLKDLPKDSARSLVVSLPRLGEGQYVLRYRGVSEDTHESKGTLRFTVSSKPAP